MIFGTIPREPPREDSLSGCAPKFADAVIALLSDLTAQGFDPILYETLRTNERQTWLYGFGRDYDDDRGIVTHAETAEWEWHHYGVAADIISKGHGWNSSSFFLALEAACSRHGLTSGAGWHQPDLPHVQFGKCKPSPSGESRSLYESGGLQAVWTAVGAA